jgi:hypothetical protein
VQTVLPHGIWKEHQEQMFTAGKESISQIADRLTYVGVYTWVEYTLVVA